MKVLRQRLMGHRGRIFDCCCDPKGDTLLTASEDGTARLWDLSSGTCQSTFSGINGNKDEILRVSWSPFGKYIATGSALGLVNIIKAQDGSSRRVCNLKALRQADSATVSDDDDENDQVYVCDFFNKTDNVILVGSDDTLRVWDLEHDRYTISLKMPAMEPNVRNPAGSNFVFGACVHFHDNFLAAALADSTVRLYDVRSGKNVMTLEGHTKFATSCSFSPSRDVMFSSSGDGTARVWDTRQWQCIRELRGHKGACYGCKLLPTAAAGGDDQCVVATWSIDSTVRFWDLIGRQNAAMIQPRYPVLNMAASPKSGSIILVGGKSDDLAGVPAWKWDLQGDTETEVSKSKPSVPKSECEVSSSEQSHKKPVKRARVTEDVKYTNNWHRWIHDSCSKQMAKRLALYNAGAAGPAQPRPRETAQLRELKTAALPSAYKGVTQPSESKGVPWPRKINGTVRPRGIARFTKPSVLVQAHATTAGILTTQSAAL